MDTVLRKVKQTSIKIFYNENGVAKTDIITLYGSCSKKKAVAEANLPEGCKFLGWELVEVKEIAMKVSLEGFIRLAKEEMQKDAG